MRFPIGRVFGFLIERVDSQIVPIVLRPPRTQPSFGMRLNSDGLEVQARLVLGAGNVGEPIAWQRLSAHDVAQFECKSLVG